MKSKFLLATAVVATLGATAASAGTKEVVGTFAGNTWKAQSTIIGSTPTSDVLPPSNATGGGNPLFWPSANKSGVVALIMDEGAAGRFICSGTLMNDRVSIVTAGHCVSSGAGTAAPISTTAYFFNGDPNSRTPFGAGTVAIDVSRYFVNPGYTGEVIDQNDIAVLKLSSLAPTSAVSYGLYNQSINGQQFNVAGYGQRSTVGGSVGNAAGAAAQTGYLREGDNIYDYAWGDAAFGGFFTDIDPSTGENFFGTAQVQYSYISDFDNGTRTNDTACRIAAAVGAPLGFGCNTGVGAREVSIAGGDSGGPGFVDGKLASVNSYGLTFGTGFGDYRAGLNDSWGEFNGFVPIYIHEDWLSGVVPEPASWAMMIAGFGMIGGALRRRRQGYATA